MLEEIIHFPKNLCGAYGLIGVVFLKQKHYLTPLIKNVLNKIYDPLR